MRKLTCLFALGFLLFNNTLRANEPEKVTSTEEVSETTAKKERIKQVTKDDDYEKFRFGGYGEMVDKVYRITERIVSMVGSITVITAIPLQFLVLCWLLTTSLIPSGYWVLK